MTVLPIDDALADDEVPDPFYAGLMHPEADGAGALARLLAQRPAWHRLAACRGMDTELWFPERGDDQSPAKAVCAGCAVRVRCELAARSRGDTGIWGGTSARERRLRRQEPPDALAG